MKGGSFLYPALIKTLLLPVMFAWLALQYLPLPRGIISQTLAYILSFPLLYISRSYWSTLVSSYTARRLGAADIPRVRGRYPLNIDILLDWARSGSEEEVGRMMVLLGRKFGKTYNTRVLGEDQVSRECFLEIWRGEADEGRS